MRIYAYLALNTFIGHKKGICFLVKIIIYVYLSFKNVIVLLLNINPIFIFQGSIRVASYDNFGVERDQTPFMDQEPDDIRGGNANG